MKKLTRLATTLLLAMLAGGCTSGPPLIQSYSLSTPLNPADGNAKRLQFRLLSVAVPERLNTELIVAQSQSGALYELANQIWASPLPDELRSTLSYSLSQKLPGIDVTYLAADPNRPVYRLRVAVQEFFTVVGERTVLATSWSLSGADIAVNCVGNYRSDLAAANSVNITSFQQLAQQLSDDIAVSLQRYAATGSACTDQ